MWFATDKGLTCYNGSSIVNVEWDGGHGCRVTDIKEDAQGHIYAATENGLYMVRMDDFVMRRVYDRCSNVKALCIIGDGTIYACSRQGLYRCADNREPMLITLEGNVMAEGNATVDVCTEPGNDHRIWVCARRKLYSIDTYTNEKKCFDLSPVLGETSQLTALDCYKGNIYIGTKDMGVLRFSIREKRAYPYSVLSNGEVHDLNVDAKGHLNVSMYNFYEIDIDRGRIVRQTKSNSAYTSFHDVDLDVTWHGHYQEGLSFNYHRRMLASHFKYNDFNSCDVCVRSFCKHGDDVVIGTREGFYHINKEKGICLYFSPEDIGANIVTSVEWFAGRFVLATYVYGLRVYDPMTHTVTVPPAFERDGDVTMFDIGDFSCFAKSHDNKTLVAAGNSGCFIFNSDMRCRYNYNAQNSKLGSEYFTSAFFDEQGKLWMGGMNRMYIIDLTSKSIINEFPESFFNNTRYLAFRQDTDGDVIAFGDGKVFKCKADLSSFVTYDLNEKPGCGNISFVYPYAGKYLVGTSIGIFLFDKHFKHYKQFAFSDNLPSLTFNKSEIQKMSDGSLWIAASKGLVCFSQSQLNQLDDSVKGRIMLDKLWVNNMVVPANRLMDMIDNPAFRITWNLGSDDIAFIPLMLNYSLNVGRLYEYQVDNGDFATSRDREIVNIRSLSLGSHTITIRLAGHPETATRYRVTVLPSVLFYFEIIFLVLLCISVYVGVDMHKRRLRHKQKLHQKHKLEREISAQNAVYDLKRQQLAEQEAQEQALEEARRQRTSTKEYRDLQNKVRQYMESERPYRNPNFRLSDLAKTVDSTPAVISLMLNQNMETNFYDYINRYRLEDFKRKYKSPSYHNLSTSAIYEKCGFKKTTFFAAFKKFEGCTPLEWMKRADGEIRG